MMNIRLSKDVTIADYLNFEKNKNREAIADFIRQRFLERYYTPITEVKNPIDHKNGFCTMAICCLMIEALVSFEEGWEDTKNRSRKAFKFFFKRHHNFACFKECSDDFYHSVRCGILHQAETRNGWKINRKADQPLVDLQTKIINATKFHREMHKSVWKYSNDLKTSSWNDGIWINFRRKMESIIENCTYQGTIESTSDSYVYYFAYGSNMSSKRLKKRVYSCKPFRIAKVLDMQVVFNKAGKDGSAKANLIPFPGHVAWGYLYKIDEKDCSILDDCEKGYDREYVVVEDDKGFAQCVLTYVSKQLTDDQRAYERYKNLVVEGAKEHHLPAEHIVYLESLGSKPDKDS